MGNGSTTIRRISDLTPDDKNANKGTERGNGFIERSLREYGAGRSILIDRNGKIIAGNKTVENAAACGLEDVIVVPTDGTRIVAVQRTDLDMDADPKARELALADNRAGDLNLEWDGAVLTELGKDIDLKPFFTTDELGRVLSKGITDVEGADETGQLSEAYQVLVECLDESQQQKLLLRLNAEGYKCRSLIS